MKTLTDELSEHPFFSGLTDADLELIAGCGENVVFKAGEFIARENDSADYFFLLRHGRVAIETSIKERGSLCLQTLKDGDIIGWSWLFPPYRWSFDVRALAQTRCVRLDGRCLRDKCAADNRLGYQLMQRFAEIMTDRLQHTRLQLLNIYDHPTPESS